MKFGILIIIVFVVIIVLMYIIKKLFKSQFELEKVAKITEFNIIKEQDSDVLRSYLHLKEVEPYLDENNLMAIKKYLSDASFLSELRIIDKKTNYINPIHPIKVNGEVLIKKKEMSLLLSDKYRFFESKSELILVEKEMQEKLEQNKNNLQTLLQLAIILVGVEFMMVILSLTN